VANKPVVGGSSCDKIGRKREMRFYLMCLSAILAFVSEYTVFAKNVSSVPVSALVFGNLSEQLMEAAKNNNIEKVESLVKQNAKCLVPTMWD